MRYAFLALVLGSLSFVALASPAPKAPAAPAAAESFAIDPVHSNVLFKVMHNNAAWFYGRFAELGGSFEYSDDPSKCSLEVDVRAESVDSRNDKLDQHLRSPDFFDSKQFPSIRFASKKVEAAGDGMYAVTGDLSLRGVTKEITIEVEKVGEGQGRGGKVLGFHTAFTIDRTDFGVNYGAGGGLGSQVELIVSIEAVQN